MAKRKLKTVTVSEGIYYMHDPAKEGGSKYYYARLGNRRVSCGKDADGLKRAKAARGRYQEQQYTHKDIRADLRVKRVKLKTVTDLLNWFMKISADRVGEKRRSRKKSDNKITPSTYRRYCQIAATLRNHLGKTMITDLMIDDLRDYRRKRREEKKAINTIYAELQLLLSAHRQAIEEKKIPTDFRLVLPKDLKEMFRESRRAITVDEYSKLLDAAGSDFRDFMVCAYETGMRSSEICNLTASQVVFNEARVLTGGRRIIANYIDLGYDTKTGKPRAVPVSVELGKVLKRRLEGLGSDGRAFYETKRNGRKQYYNNTLVVRRFRKACKGAGVPHGDTIDDETGKRRGVVFHCFKVTRVTIWYEEGKPLHLISMACGTDTERIIKEHYADADKGSAMELVAETHKQSIQSVPSISQAIEVTG